MESKSLEVNEALSVLATGEIEVLGLLPYSSNYVFLVRVGELEKADRLDDPPEQEKAEHLAIYKPSRGERPLWDFPANTLAAREVAAFLVSEAGDWRFVPPTVLREDAPLGPGSLQLFIDHDPERHYFVLVEEDVDRFDEFVAFDIVVNNADRKAGHILEAKDGRLWAVDHGLMFNAEPKLRTVIWDLAGRSISVVVRQRLEALLDELRSDGALGGELAKVLSPEEVSATARRVEELLLAGTFPEPTSRHHLPWPLV